MFGRRRATVETARFGDHELRIEVLRAGTRSEGRVGRLFVSGDEVRGSRGDTVVVPGGPTLVHLGDDRPHLWSASGWALHGQ